jgi:glycine betaine/proline transport system permease protein
MQPGDLLDPFQHIALPVGDWADSALLWTVSHFRVFFHTVSEPVAFILSSVDRGLRATPPLVGLIGFSLLGWQVGGLRLGWTTLACFLLIGLLGVWSDAMTTLGIVVTGVIFCALIGVPIGIMMARSDPLEALIRPMLDLLQTIPSFVYLVPVVMLFGIGDVPGVIVTILYALPPVIRLTNLGIRQVSPDVVEAAAAFGASPRQILLKVQMPLGLPTIMAGVNQTVMMALAMTVVASMIAVGGLGNIVLRGIGRLDMGLSTVGGLCIVLLAIAIDRISQGFGLTSRDWGHRRWYHRGPAGLLSRILGRRHGRPPPGSAGPGGGGTRHPLPAELRLWSET